MKNKLSHLSISNFSKSENFTSTGRPPPQSFPIRDRQSHANFLLTKLNESIDLKNQSSSETVRDSEKGILGSEGIYLEIISEPGENLKIESLDLPSQGIQLLNIKEETVDDKVCSKATVYIQDKSISTFIEKFRDYRDKDTSRGKPKNNDLVNSISDIKLALLKSLWTDVDELFPKQNDTKIWWEVWFRCEDSNIDEFKEKLKNLSIVYQEDSLYFNERIVFLIYCSINQLLDSIDILDYFAELRLAKETTSDFIQMKNFDQLEWVESLAGRINYEISNNLPIISILDTGVNNKHALIKNFLSNESLFSFEDSWGTEDHNGHGTAMAGLVLYQDLSNALLSSHRINVPAILESIKILPPPHLSDNDPRLYGFITEQSILQAVSKNRSRNRILCLAVSSHDGRDCGKPSSWSGAIDKIISGTSIEGFLPLMIVAAGNKVVTSNYPKDNLVESIHDPAQSWNSIVVGACTLKTSITDEHFIPGWEPIAEAGDLAPSSTTSFTWDNKWPYKPDVVFEGGNAAIDSEGNVDEPTCLSLLSTHHSITKSQFTWHSDTSAACAQVSNIAANIFARYPDYWAETVRALIIHSAEWTPKMLKYPVQQKRHKQLLLKMFGYGVPNLDRALYSASNCLTLISQSYLKPFKKDSMNQLNIHELPWPKEELEGLGEKNVKLKVTLSYFIEPNPSRRGWNNKYCYQSHGLRFAMKTSIESLDSFRKRINKDLQAKDEKVSSSTSDDKEWFLGENYRTKGSIHSDSWEGTAISLSEKDCIAVYPVVGWYRAKKDPKYYDAKIRYSLVVTIVTSEEEVDIYTPVENTVAIANEVSY